MNEIGSANTSILAATPNPSPIAPYYGPYYYYCYYYYYYYY